jgi:hypothetical protein
MCYHKPQPEINGQGVIRIHHLDLQVLTSLVPFIMISFTLNEVQALIQ